MSKRDIYSIIIFLFSLVSSLNAQNFLSPIWKIRFTDTLTKTSQSIQDKQWKKVNLLLSWERQGYFGQNGTCNIATDFSIPKTYKNNQLELTIGLHCYVQGIYVNDHFIGGSIPNSFWSDPNKKTTFSIPTSILNDNQPNRIVVVASNLSYTGGKSYMCCQIHPVNSKNNSLVAIVFSTKNHVFKLKDETVGLSLQTNAANKGKLTLNIFNDFHEPIMQRILTIQKGIAKTFLTLSDLNLPPGFYECTAILDDGGFSGTVSWFSVAPEKIKCENDTIKGFGPYWDKNLNDLKKVAPEFRMHKVDSLSSGKRDGYVIEMQSLGNLTVRGYYFVPRGKEKYPAILHVPGYGYGFQNIKEFLERKENVVELALCVRGHGISADVFHPGFGIPGVWGWNLCSETDNAYRSIYMDCVRAVEFLMSRPEINTSKIGVEGGSQGGGLALATAGLCPKNISALAYFDPFPSDLRDHKNIRTVMQQDLKSYLEFYNNACTFEDALHIQDLLDTKGFAYTIECPVFFATALFDDDCPPHVGFSAYNRIKSVKEYKVFPEDSHLGESNYQKEFMVFFGKQFGF
jgi:cephalosporin-C deacetylase-like acetyl esterase